MIEDYYCTGERCNDREKCMRFSKLEHIPINYDYIKGKTDPYEDCADILKDE